MTLALGMSMRASISEALLNMSISAEDVAGDIADDNADGARQRQDNCGSPGLGVFGSGGVKSS